jgi:hypothetical protein
MRGDFETQTLVLKESTLLAYIDPAVGSMLLQSLGALALAAMVMGRRLLLVPLEWLYLRRPASAPEAEMSEAAGSEGEK